MKRNLVFILFVVLTLASLKLNAQNAVIDSLENLLQSHRQQDTTKVNLLNATAAKSFSVNDDKALLYAKEAGNLADLLSFEKGKAESLKNTAFYYLRRADYSNSLNYYNRALAVYEKIDHKNRVSLCQNNIGVIYKNQGDYIKALEFHQKALKTREDLAYNYGIISSLINIGVIYYSQSDYPKALEYYNKALKIQETINDKGPLATNLNNIGVIYQDQGDYYKALDYYNQSLIIREEINDQSGIISSMINIGVLFYLKNELDKALGYYYKALKLSEDINSTPEISDLLNNIGIIYENRGDYYKAIEYQQKALMLREELGDKRGSAKALNNIGSIYKNLKNYPKALESYQKALEIASRIGAKENMGSNNNGLASIYLITGHIRKAYDYSQKAYIIAKEIGSVKLLKESSDVLARSSALLGLYKEAYTSQLVFKKMNDSLFNESNIKNITDLENQYKFKREKQAIELEQQKKDVIQQEELRRQKMTRNAFVVGFLLMIVLAFVIFRSFIQKRKANDLLARQKEEIQEQAEELKTANDKLVELDSFKENMTGMIVHDLKNPLNAILNVPEQEPQSSLQLTKLAGRQMLNLVMNMLDVHKYEASKFIVEKTNLSLYELSQKANNDVAFLADQKSIEISNEIDPNIGVYADMEIVERIFVNILTNAIKYTPNNGSIFLKSENRKDKKQIYISISDTGQGIPEVQLHSIFDKFGQISAKRSGNIRSTGLGLTFCKMAVEAHGGEIGVESNKDSGSTFWFTLPMGHAQENRQFPEKAVGKKYELSKIEKELIKPFIEDLNKLMVYEVSSIKKVMKLINHEDSASMLLWKQEIDNAIFSMNEEKYHELIHRVRMK